MTPRHFVFSDDDVTLLLAGLGMLRVTWRLRADRAQRRDQKRAAQATLAHIDSLTEHLSHSPPFVEWLRAQLETRKMTQRQLAQRSGVHHTTISRLLGGDRTPAPETIVRLTRSLHARKPEPTVLAGRVRRVG